MEQIKLILREDKKWEQVVFAEVLVPNTLNVYNDFMTPDAVREAAYLFAKHGYGIDIEHDNVDITGSVYVVESFIAREGDPDFILGSWVVGMKIEDPDLWQAVLDNEINGYSYEALVQYITGLYLGDEVVMVSGETEPDPEDGHVHTYVAFLDDTGRDVSGGTDVVNGHEHQILQSTITEEADGHRHRFNIV